jgi:hypothetical protein
MHGMLETPEGYTLMAADTPPGMPFTPGNTITISLSGDDEDQLREYLGQVGQRRLGEPAPGQADVGRRLRHVRRQVRCGLDGQHHPGSVVLTHAVRSGAHAGQARVARRGSSRPAERSCCGREPPTRESETVAAGVRAPRAPRQFRASARAGRFRPARGEEWRSQGGSSGCGVTGPARRTRGAR